MKMYNFVTSVGMRRWRKIEKLYYTKKKLTLIVLQSEPQNSYNVNFLLLTTQESFIVLDQW